jgi:hypothetical protein
VPEKIAKQFEEQMSKPDLVFVTKANQEMVENAAKEQNIELPPDHLATLSNWTCKKCGEIEKVSLVQCLKCQSNRAEKT